MSSGGRSPAAWKAARSPSGSRRGQHQLVVLAPGQRLGPGGPRGHRRRLQLELDADARTPRPDGPRRPTSPSDTSMAAVAPARRATPPRPAGPPGAGGPATSAAVAAPSAPVAAARPEQAQSGGRAPRDRSRRAGRRDGPPTAAAGGPPRAPGPTAVTDTTRTGDDGQVPAHHRAAGGRGGLGHAVPQPLDRSRPARPPTAGRRTARAHGGRDPRRSTISAFQPTSSGEHSAEVDVDPVDHQVGGQHHPAGRPAGSPRRRRRRSRSSPAERAPRPPRTGSAGRR